MKTFYKYNPDGSLYYFDKQILEVRQTESPAVQFALSTQVRIKTRWYRLYAAPLGNSGSVYIKKDGTRQMLGTSVPMDHGLTPKGMYLDQIVKAYLSCAAWTEGAAKDFTKEAKKQAAEDVEDFIDLLLGESPIFNVKGYKNRHDISNLFEQIMREINATQFGDSFWFNRNRHGAGFWDIGTHPMFNKVSDWAKTMGTKEVTETGNGKYLQWT